MKNLVEFLLETKSNNIIEFTIPDDFDLYEEIKSKKYNGVKVSKVDDDYLNIKFDINKSDEFIKNFWGDEYYNRLDKNDLINGWLNIYYDALWIETNGECKDELPEDCEPQEIFDDADTSSIMAIAKNKLNELGYKFEK